MQFEKIKKELDDITNHFESMRVEKMIEEKETDIHQYTERFFDIHQKIDSLSAKERALLHQNLFDLKEIISTLLEQTTKRKQKILQEMGEVKKEKKAFNAYAQTKSYNTNV